MKQAAVANPRSFRTRLMFAFGVLALAAAGLVARAVDLQLVHNDFLLAEGDQRYIRDVPTVAHRGMITDRNGEPLAVSTPGDSVAALSAAIFVAAVMKASATRRCTPPRGTRAKPPAASGSSARASTAGSARVLELSR